MGPYGSWPVVDEWCLYCPRASEGTFMSYPAHGLVLSGYCELPCFVDAVVLCRPAVLAAHHCILRRFGAGAGILSAFAQYPVYISGSCAHHFVAGLDERAG